MAGTPQKMLEYLLETRLPTGRMDDNVVRDSLLEDFLLTHVIFMPSNHLCPILMAQYPFIMQNAVLLYVLCVLPLGIGSNN